MAKPVQIDRDDLVLEVPARGSRPSARSWLASANSSISSREMSHFSAIISAPRNWETSWSPYRCSQPGDSVVGEVKPYCSPTSIAEEIGIWLMFCTPPATTRSGVPDMIACAAKCTACWLRAALPVDGHAGHVVGQPGDQPGGPGDVAGLRADGVAAAEDDVVDRARVDVGAVEQAAPARARRGRRSARRRAPRRACRPAVRTASTM